MAFVRLDGCDLYYEEAGQGRPDPADSPFRGHGRNLGLGDRGVGPDRPRDHLRPPGLRPLRRPPGARCLCIRLTLQRYWRPWGPRPPWWSGPAPGRRSPSTWRCVVRTWCGWSSPMNSPGGLPGTFPTGSQVLALAKIGSLALRGRQGDAAEALLRSAYSYRDGGSAWDTVPEAWRQAARDNAKATLVDFRTRSATIHPRRSWRLSRSRWCAATVPGAPPAWLALVPVDGRCHPRGENPAN